MGYPTVLMFAPNNTEPISTYPRQRSTKALIAWAEKTSDPNFEPEPYSRSGDIPTQILLFFVSFIINYWVYILLLLVMIGALVMIYSHVVVSRKSKTLPVP
jgi:hypothetical protein